MPKIAREKDEVKVGEVIRRIRLGRGISVRMFAAKAGFSPSFISQVELGQISPSIASLARIGAVLGVALGDLFGEREGEVPASALRFEEQSALLPLVFAHSQDGMAFIDPNFVIRAVNETYAEQGDVPPSKMIGRAMEDVFPGWAEQAKPIYEQVRESGQPFRSEAYPYILKRGCERGLTFWDVSISPVHGPAGVFLGYLLAHRDVTERRKAEQERERAIEQLRRVNARLVLSSVPMEQRAWPGEIRAAERGSIILA